MNEEKRSLIQNHALSIILDLSEITKRAGWVACGSPSLEEKDIREYVEGLSFWVKQVLLLEVTALENLLNWESLMQGVDDERVRRDQDRAGAN